MFRFTSTGEPPTMASSQEDVTAFQSKENIQQKTNRGMPSLSAQEDSGYEASPSSTNDNCSFSFDGRRKDSEDTPAQCPDLEDVNAPDDAFGDSSSAILMMGGQDDYDIDEEDLVGGDYEDEGSFAGKWALEPSSPETSTIVGSDNCRPSSLPIPIPMPFGDEPLSSRLCPAVDTDCYYLRRLNCHSLPIDVPPSATASPTSPATTFSPVAERLSTTFPFSWPSIRPILRTAGPVSLLSLRLAFAGSPTSQRTNRALTARSSMPRSRRRIIDSDASSISSSEGDPSEEVFDAEPAVDAMIPLAPSAPTANGHLIFLPDVVPHSGATGSINMNGVRRSRSVSVNLPIEDAVVEVGRTLRRLSDQFNEQIRMRRTRRNRRYTIGDIMRLTGKDFDDDNSHWRS